MINEVGAISADDLLQRQAGHITKPIPQSYWNLVGAMFAYLYGECSNLGIDVIAASQMVGYPTQYPSVSLVDWNTGKPNSRFWVIKLLRDQLGPGYRVVATAHFGNMVYAQGFVGKDNWRKLLVVNQRNVPVDIVLKGATGNTLYVVDQKTTSNPPRAVKLASDTFEVDGYGVAVLCLAP